MGADRNQWQFPRNVAGAILGWRDDGKGMANKVIGEDIQEHSDNLDELATVTPGEAGKDVLAAETLTDAAAAVGLPPITADTMLVDNAAGAAREAKFLDYIQNLLGIFDTRAEAAAFTIPAAIDAVRLNGDSTISDGEGGLFIDTNNGSTDTFTSAGGTARTWYRVADVGLDRIGFTIQSDITVDIPGDFATLQSAVDFYSRFIVKQGVRINLNIQSGHQPATGLLVKDGDYSHFYIRSEDAEVDLASGFVGVVAPPDGGTTITSGTFIMALRARGPVLGTIIDANGAAGARTGYFVLRGGVGYADRPAAPTEEIPVLSPIAGCKNFSHANGQAQEGSILIWENAVATGSGLNGLYAERASIIHAEFSDVSNAAQGGFVAARGSTINASTAKANNCRIGMWALRACTINADDSEAKNCKDYGYYSSFGSTINAHNSDASGALATGDDATFGGTGYYAYHGSRINTSSAIANSCVKYGALARGGSHIEFDASSATSCGVAVYATDGSAIDAESVVANSCTGAAAIDADSNSTINANGASATGAPTTAVRARTGASVNVENATLTGAGSHGVYADNGARINANGANVTGPATNAVRCNHGSFINISNGTTRAANPGVPQAADTSIGALNTISGSGSIFHIV